MSDIIDKITDYLASGGLFNPELMDGPATRDLLLDCRNEITRMREILADMQAAQRVKSEPEPIPAEVLRANEICRECGTKRWLHNAMLHPFNPYTDA